LSNRISTGASDKVNRLIKKTLQSFRCILSILFLIYSIICNLEVKLSGFHNCLAEYTVRCLSHCYGLLTALRLLNSVARSWQRWATATLLKRRLRYSYLLNLIAALLHLLLN